MTKCSCCDTTKKQLEKDGYNNIELVKCRKCKQWFCEACLIDNEACPNCSDLYYI